MLNEREPEPALAVGTDGITCGILVGCRGGRACLAPNRRHDMRRDLPTLTTLGRG